MKRISVVSNIREKSRKFAPGISRAWRPPASGWTRSNVRTRVLHADAHAERKNCEQQLVLQLPKQHAQPPHLSLQRRTSRFCLGRRNRTTHSEKRVRASQQYCTRVHTFALEISHISGSEYLVEFLCSSCFVLATVLANRTFLSLLQKNDSHCILSADVMVRTYAKRSFVVLWGVKSAGSMRITSSLSSPDLFCHRCRRQYLNYILSHILLPVQCTANQQCTRNRQNSKIFHVICFHSHAALSLGLASELIYGCSKGNVSTAMPSQRSPINSLVCLFNASIIRD